VDASGSTTGCTVTSDSTTITWHPGSRVAVVRYTAGASLVAADGAFLADALTGWIGTEGKPFAVLADGTGLRGTDAEYRASAHGFFRRHRSTSCIALIHLGPVIRIVVEMFRLGTGIQLKEFASEDAARAWLRTKGIAA
jgi:hypothetical protein